MNIAQLQNKTFKCSLCIFTYSFYPGKITIYGHLCLYIVIFQYRISLPVSWSASTLLMLFCVFYMYYYVSLRSQLQFPHTNYIRFIFTSSCLFYLHYLALFVHSGFQYTLCCVFLRLVDSFSGMSISDCSSVFSKVYCNTLFQLDTEQIIMESHYYAYYTIIVYIV